jgi:hypothetical protein
MATQLDPHKTPERTRPAPRFTVRRHAVPYTRLHRPHAHRIMPQRLPLPGISSPNLALAGLQLLVGYEWLVSGVDKVLLGAFPDRIGGLLTAAVSGGHLPGFFAALLQNIVLPNAQFFGVIIEWGELLAGLGLVAAGLVTLLRPLAERYLKLRVALVFSYGAHLLDLLAPVAAIGAALMGLTFFLLDGLPLPWFAPSVAYGGAIDTGLFLAVASVILIAGQLLQRRQRA